MSNPAKNKKKPLFRGVFNALFLEFIPIGYILFLYYINSIYDFLLVSLYMLSFFCYYVCNTATYIINWDKPVEKFLLNLSDSLFCVYICTSFNLTFAYIIESNITLIYYYIICFSGIFLIYNKLFDYIQHLLYAVLLVYPLIYILSIKSSLILFLFFLYYAQLNIACYFYFNKEIYIVNNVIEHLEITHFFINGASLAMFFINFLIIKYKYLL